MSAAGRLPAMVCLAALALALGACEPHWYPDPALVSQGEAVFRQHCARCHGEQGVGQNPSDPFGSDDPARGFVAPALNGRGHCSSHTPGELAGLIRDGTGVPGSPMLGFHRKLSDRDYTALVTYLFQLWPPAIRNLYERRHRAELNRMTRPGS